MYGSEFKRTLRYNCKLRSLIKELLEKTCLVLFNDVRMKLISVCRLSPRRASVSCTLGDAGPQFTRNAAFTSAVRERERNTQINVYACVHTLASVRRVIKYRERCRILTRKQCFLRARPGLNLSPGKKISGRYTVRVAWKRYST